MRKIRPERLAYIVKRYPRYSETFIVNEILAHEAAGVEVVIFALRPSIDSHFQDIISKVQAPVYYLPRKQVRLSEWWKQIRESAASFDNFWQKLAASELEEDPYCLYQGLVLAHHLQAMNIDHIHAHFMNTASSVARLASRLTRIPFSVTAHAKDIFHQSVNAENVQQLFNDAKYMVTVSEYNLDYLSSHYDIRIPLLKIYNGLDLTDFPFTEKTDADNIIAVGRLVEKKGFHHLLDACALLKSRGLSLSCRIVGGGEHYDLLERRIADLELADCVQLTGPVPQHRLKEMIAQAGILVAPCIVGIDGNRDGLPTVLLEAMALGTPCVSTDVTGIPEAVIHGKTGLIAAAGDAGALANQIQNLAENTQLAKTLARNARQKVEFDFNIHKNTKHMRELMAHPNTNRID